MKKRKTLNRILATVCFECCNTAQPFAYAGLQCRPKGQHSELGSKVDLNGKCAGCPVGVLRGDGAPVSKGMPSSIFRGQLIPGEDCITGEDGVQLNSLDLWKPCSKCSHATVEGAVITVNDLHFCTKYCPAREMLDILQENEAEARMS